VSMPKELLKDTLLVTFPVDLGNRTLESNQHEIFKNDMDFFRFAEKHAGKVDLGGASISSSLAYRFQSSLALRKIVKKYTDRGRKVLFNGLSPALFSYGAWKPKQTAIVFDWTRTLYPSVLGQTIEKNWIYKLHRKVLCDCPKFLCWTDAIKNNLSKVYGVKEKYLFKVPAPFLVEKLDMAPRPTNKEPKVLFVGGDLKRKGGDILLKAWPELKDQCSLTMMTNNPAAAIDGINFLPGVQYGTSFHKRTFEEHDILILPTKIDAYPQVIGEAAAAGLAVITTKFALGAKEVIENGITGFIADSPEESIQQLKRLLKDRNLIDDFKRKGYERMHREFNKEKIRQGYLGILNDNKEMQNPTI
jgi:glycosyltransferase involved in cell wall biosynthesis